MARKGEEDVGRDAEHLDRREGDRGGRRRLPSMAEILARSESWSMTRGMDVAAGGRVVTTLIGPGEDETSWPSSLLENRFARTEVAAAARSMSSASRSDR